MTANRKVLLLTGASRGIGHATVKRFSDSGWRIITCSREAVPEECKRDPNWTHHITADLANPQDLCDLAHGENGGSVGVVGHPFHSLSCSQVIERAG